MRDQLHISRLGLLTEETIRPVKNFPRLMLKPALSGIWTSTYTPEEAYLSDWVRYCMTENNTLISGVRHVQILKPKKEARILEVTRETLEEIIYKKYMLEEKIIHGGIMGALNMHKYEIDFEKLSQDYDAIHYIPGILTIGLDFMQAMELRFENPFTAWDCESTLWFRWMFEDNAIIKKVSFPEPISDDDWWDELGEE